MKKSTKRSLKIIKDKLVWLQPWKQPNYLEWALKKTWGYIIILARKQPKNWLLASARWVFAKEGLPFFEVVEKKLVKTKKEALAQLEIWKKRLTV